MAEQTARKTDRGVSAAADTDPKLRQQIGHYVVVVAGIERNLVTPPAHRQRARHVERLVAIERRDLHRRDVFDLEKLAPEAVIQQATADRWLKIEPEKRNDLGHVAAMSDHFRHRSLLRRR